MSLSKMLSPTNIFILVAVAFSGPKPQNQYLCPFRPCRLFSARRLFSGPRASLWALFFLLLSTFRTQWEITRILERTRKSKRWRVEKKKEKMKEYENFREGAKMQIWSLTCVEKTKALFSAPKESQGTWEKQSSSICWSGSFRLSHLRKYLFDLRRIFYWLISIFQRWSSRIFHEFLNFPNFYWLIFISFCRLDLLKLIFMI